MTHNISKTQLPEPEAVKDPALFPLYCIMFSYNPKTHKESIANAYDKIDRLEVKLTKRGYKVIKPHKTYLYKKSRMLAFELEKTK